MVAISNILHLPNVSRLKTGTGSAQHCNFYIQKKPVLLEIIYNFTVLYIQNITSVFRTPRVNNKEYIPRLV